MMRLIDADVLIAEICQDQCERKYCDCDYTCSLVEFAVNAPTVPAVPLDKLCRMLAKYIGFPCNYSPIDEEMADYCGDQCEMDDIDCWKKVLSKWMEGLDDHRSTD